MQMISYLSMDMKRIQIVLVWGCMIALCSCGGTSNGDKSSEDEIQEIEFIRPVKEPSTDVVDTIGFPEESQGTPIKGYQGYPEDDLVKESTDDDIVNFDGAADLEYHDGGGDYSDGY